MNIHLTWFNWLVFDLLHNGEKVDTHVKTLF